MKRNIRREFYGGLRWKDQESHQYSQNIVKWCSGSFVQNMIKKELGKLKYFKLSSLSQSCLIQIYLHSFLVKTRKPNCKYLCIKILREPPENKNLYLEFLMAICLDNQFVHIGYLYSVTLGSCTNDLLET